ncbi:MAG: hypothetical protein KDD94_00415, partial [Calditrichaeota bacterium]|nr:hypothetical protein [Calditrichota bacterium]
MKQLLYLSLLICLLSQNYRDGKIFDSGLAMKKRADNAPLVLDKLNFMIGQWDIDFTYHPNDTTSISSQGKSEISFMNRGHGIMERNYIQNFNANDDEWNSMSFLAFNTVTKSWSIGIANSFTESIEILDGDFENNKLILRNAIRRLGGATLTYYNYSINQLNDRQFEMIMKTSTDHMKSWKTSYSCRYTKRQFSENFIGS